MNTLIPVLVQPWPGFSLVQNEFPGKQKKEASDGGVAELGHGRKPGNRS